MKLTKKQAAAVIAEAENAISGEDGISTVAGILTTIQLLDCDAELEERITDIILNALRLQDTIAQEKQALHSDGSMDYHLPDDEWPVENEDGNHACKAGFYDNNIGHERCVLCDQPMGLNQWHETPDWSPTY